MNKADFETYRDEMTHHLTQELLPFWLDRALDRENGGFITHFDENGVDTGEDEKSLIAQTRTVYTMSAAHRAGYGNGVCAEYARHGLDFLLDRMWDTEYGGFFWTVDRKGNPVIKKKILYGHSFAIYALAEYTRATGDPAGREYAEKVFDLVQINCTETSSGGYLEMFEQDWTLCGPGSAGGDRKTLDVHMHLMEAFTSLYAVTGKELHARKLREDIRILKDRMMTGYGTGIPQFTVTWEQAPQIKFDIVWGWDRFDDSGQKKNPLDNTSYGHNVEFAWLLMEALQTLNDSMEPYDELILKAMDHAVTYGIDESWGGVYVEGSHNGPSTDHAKEFWQQAEVLTGMLDAYLRYKDEKYLDAYANVHRFVMNTMIHHAIGEWWPLTTREGEPIWRHMSHSWKVNYHTIRGAINCIDRLSRVIEGM
jgi:mannose 2-epimerase